MGSHSRLPPTSSFTLLVFIIASGVNLSKCTNITLLNDCKETVWPGITASINFTVGGYELKPGQSVIFTAPQGWGGRIWGRTGCKFDQSGNGTCQTGSCGSTLLCTSPGNPPASIAEFSLTGDTNYYDVSLVDGFNLPLTITPISGKGNCSIAGCDNDLRENCPQELTLKSDGKNIACWSACNVFNSDEYCCKGMYSSPMTCLPTNYSRIFKSACPVAYSYAFDDPTSILTCTSSDYIVTFCSARNQTQCTFHDNKLVCSSSNGMKVLPRLWSIFVLVLPIVMSFANAVLA